MSSLSSSPQPLSTNVSFMKPNLRDNHHSSAISTESLADSECEEMLCCQLEALVSPRMSGERGQWRLSTTPNGPWFPVQGPLNGLHYVSLKHQNGLYCGLSPTSLYRDEVLGWNSRVFIMNAHWRQKRAIEDIAKIYTRWYRSFTMKGNKVLCSISETGNLFKGLIFPCRWEIDNCNLRRNWRAHRAEWRTRRKAWKVCWLTRHIKLKTQSDRIGFFFCGLQTPGAVPSASSAVFGTARCSKCHPRWNKFLPPDSWNKLSHCWKAWSLHGNVESVTFGDWVRPRSWSVSLPWVMSPCSPCSLCKASGLESVGQ